MNRIWLIGGTHESAELARRIAARAIPCVVTVTTAAATQLYPDTSSLTPWVGRLDTEQIATFLQSHQIKAILDASHPFAAEISQLAITTAATYHLPYLRYERPCLHDPPATGFDLMTELDSFQTLLTGNYLAGQRVMLTLGYRNLQQFQPWQARSTLFVRILPSCVSLQAALEAGFTEKRIIAMRPPISRELEKALWQHWQISLAVTKASGRAGGEEIKRAVAVELGIPLITIRRPTVEYPQQTDRFEVALEFCSLAIGG